MAVPVSRIVIPPASAPFYRRLPLYALREASRFQEIGFRAYNKIMRLTKQQRLGRTYFGAKLECDLSDLIPRYIFYFGVWEPHVSALIQDALRPGDVFCDIGANIGYHSLLASRIIGAAGRVVAIEASPSTFTKLTRNLALNQAENVRAVNVAVTATAGPVMLYRGPPGNTSQTTTIPGRHLLVEGTVPGQPFLDVLTEEERTKLRFIKIDVEGAELPILRQLLESLDSLPAEVEILVEMSNIKNAEAVAEIFARFAECGFAAYSVSNPYNLVDYINFCGVDRPEPIALPLRRQQDVLFSKVYGRSREFGADPERGRRLAQGHCSPVTAIGTE